MSDSVVNAYNERYRRTNVKKRTLENGTLAWELGGLINHGDTDEIIEFLRKHVRGPEPIIAMINCRDNDLAFVAALKLGSIMQRRATPPPVPDEAQTASAEENGQSPWLMLPADVLPSLEERDVHGRTELCRAVNNQPGYAGNKCSPDAAATERVLTVLLSMNVDVNAPDNYGKTPLHNAVEIFDGQNRASTKLLQKDDAAAVVAGRLHTIEMLLDHDANMEAQDENGNTPLHVATLKSFHEGMRLLIERNADVNATNSVNSTALHVAAENGFTQCMKVLLDTAATINAHGQQQRTPLHLVAMNDAPRRLECMRMLLKHGANVEAQDEDGSTPLHVSAGSSSALKSMRMLLKHGANVEARTGDGSTPLHVSATERRLESMRVLLEHGANVEARTGEGSTPLHTSASGWFTNGVQLLLDKNANIEATATGDTPLQMALNQDYNETGFRNRAGGPHPNRALFHGDCFDTVFTLILRGAVWTTDDGHDFVEVEPFRDYVNYIRSSIEIIVYKRSDEIADIVDLSDVTMIRKLAVDLGLPTLFAEVFKRSTWAQIQDTREEISRGPRGNWADNVLRDLCRPPTRANYSRTIDGRATILTVLLVYQRLAAVRDSLKVLAPSADADLTSIVSLPAVPIELWIETLFKFMRWDPNGQIIATATETIHSVLTHRRPSKRIGEVRRLLANTVRCRLDDHKDALLHYLRAPKALSVDARVEWHVKANADVVASIDEDVASMIFGRQTEEAQGPTIWEAHHLYGRAGVAFAKFLRANYYSGFPGDEFQDMVFALLTAACCVAADKFIPADLKHPMLKMAIQQKCNVKEQKKMLEDARKLRDGKTVSKRECAQMAAGWVGLFLARSMVTEGKQTLSEGAILALNAALYGETETAPPPEDAQHSVTVYLVVAGHPLSDNLSTWGCRELRTVPEKEGMLTSIQSSGTSHLYELPAIPALARFVAKWSPLQNNQHAIIDFDHDLTQVEKAYLKLIQSHDNPLVEWDLTGEWSCGTIDKGVGIVGGGDGIDAWVPQNTIVLGFKN